jgi:hypothetical protein
MYELFGVSTIPGEPHFSFNGVLMDKDEALRLRRLVNSLFFKKSYPGDSSVPNTVYLVNLSLNGRSLSIKI